MGNPASPPFEDYLAHLEWVRSLARGLLRDDLEAEDLVQETLERAWRRPPARSSSPRAWLASVLRSRFLHKLRADRRRRHWEERAASLASAHVPTPEELAQGLEAQRSFLDALEALPDPYRGVLWMRYGLDQAPAEIAAALDRPESTVRTQLQRGRDRLREALGGDEGAWRDSCLAVLGLPPAAWPVLTGEAPPPPLARPSVLAAPLAKIALSAAALATVAGVAWWWSAGDGRPAPTVLESSPVPTGSGPEGPAKSPAGPAGQAPIVGERRPIPGGGSGGEADSGPFQDPQPGAPVGAGASKGSLPVRLLTPEGEPLIEILRGLVPQPELMQLAVVATREAPPSLFPVTDLRSLAHFGASVYSGRDHLSTPIPGLPPGFDGLLDAGMEPPFHISLLFRQVVLASRVFAAHESEIEFLVAPEQVTGLLGELRLRLVDADSGGPLTGVEFVALGTRDSVTPGTPDPFGELVFPGQAPGILQLTVLAEDHEIVQYVLELPPGGRIDLGDFPVGAASSQHGRVLDADGLPLAGVQVTAASEDRIRYPQSLHGIVAAETDAEGRFVLDRLGAGNWLLTHHAPQPYGAQTLRVDGSAGKGGEALLRLTPGAEVEINTRWSAFEAHFVTIRRDDAERLPVYAELLPGNTTRTIRLVPGPYLVEIADRTGLQSREPHHVQGPTEILNLDT